MRAIDDLPFEAAIPIRVRLATARDLDRVLALWASDARARGRLERDVRAEPPWLELLLAERGERLLACAAFAVSYASAGSKPELAIEEWLVAPGAPASHDPLVRGCAEQAIARACAGMRLDPSDPVARRAWLRAGAVERGGALYLEGEALSALARSSGR